MSAIYETETWFVGAGLVPDEPTPDVRRAAQLTGQQMDELARKIYLFNPSLGNHLHQYALALMGGECDRMVREAMASPDRTASMLQQDIRIIWNSVGAARALGARIGDAYKAEIEAMWKLEHPDGTFKLDVRDLPVVPPSWVAPNYKEYIAT